MNRALKDKDAACQQATDELIDGGRGVKAETVTLTLEIRGHHLHSPSAVAQRVCRLGLDLIELENLERDENQGCLGK